MKKFIAAFFAIPMSWVAGAVFVLTAAESALFIGFVVPGEVTAILGGVIASRGRVPLAAVLLAAVAGAWCGDSIGFFGGRRAGRDLFGKRRRKNWAKARAFLKRGGIAILVGRFTPFIRTIMPAAAGAAKMPYRRFLPWNLAGGFLWGSASTLLGYWGGRDAENVVHRAGIAGTVMFAAALAILFFLGKRVQAGRSSRSRARARRLRSGATRART